MAFCKIPRSIYSGPFPKERLQYQEYLREHQGEIRQGKILTKVQKQISLLNQQIKLIHRSATLDPEDKRIKIDDLLERRNRIFSDTISRFSG
jgi:hypothetical protein